MTKKKIGVFQQPHCSHSHYYRSLNQQSKFKILGLDARFNNANIILEKLKVILCQSP